MKNIKLLVIVFIATIFALSSCVKRDFDNPTEKEYTYDYTKDTSVFAKISITDLIAKYPGGRVIDTSFVICGTVISDDTQSNFYKKMCIQDSTGGIEIEIDMYNIQAQFPVGELVYVKCKNLVLSEYKGVQQLNFLTNGSAERMPQSAVIDHIIRVSGGKPIVPKVVTIAELNSSMINTLVKIEDVQFIGTDTTKTYADYEEPTNRNLEDFSENQIILRTSGYADFYNEILPSGSGDIVAVYGVYNSTKQLYIRNTDDVDLTKPRIQRNYLLDVSFNSDISSFSTFSVKGTAMWEHGSYGGIGYMEMSGYNAGENEDWLISPTVDMPNNIDIIFMFNHKVGYLKDWSKMTVWVSEDYDGTSDPSTQGNWSEITGWYQPIVSGSDWSDVVSSGLIDVSQYAGKQNVHFAFKYVNTSNSDASTWNIISAKVIAK